MAQHGYGCPLDESLDTSMDKYVDSLWIRAGFRSAHSDCLVSMCKCSNAPALLVQLAAELRIRCG
jgi:hypothetical protein